MGSHVLYLFSLILLGERIWITTFRFFRLLMASDWCVCAQWEELERPCNLCYEWCTASLWNYATWSFGWYGSCTQLVALIHHLMLKLTVLLRIHCQRLIYSSTRAEKRKRTFFPETWIWHCLNVRYGQGIPLLISWGLYPLQLQKIELFKTYRSYIGSLWSLLLLLLFITALINVLSL